jgi:TolB protein
MRPFPSLLATVLAAALVLAGAPARAELQIEITEGVDTALPIAVVPFGWQGAGSGPPLDAAGIVAADLARSGRFAPLARKDMLQTPTTGAEVRFDDWRRQGSEVLVVGRVLQPVTGQYEIQFQVFDVLRGEQLLGYRQPATAADFRRSCHRVADLIYEKLTGVRGAHRLRYRHARARTVPGRDQEYLPARTCRCGRGESPSDG